MEVGRGEKQKEIQQERESGNRQERDSTTVFKGGDLGSCPLVMGWTPHLQHQYLCCMFHSSVAVTQVPPLASIPSVR